MEDLAPTFTRVLAAVSSVGWPGVEVSTSYGTPALKVRGKLILRVREPGILVFVCDIDEKEFLMQAMPEIYFQTDHYKGYPAVLARLDQMTTEDLCDRIEKTCRSVASKLRPPPPAPTIVRRSPDPD